jgi:dihydroneopterin aldolase
MSARIRKAECLAHQDAERDRAQQIGSQHEKCFAHKEWIRIWKSEILTRMDIIFLQDVKVQTVLGVPEWERMKPQTVVLDIELAMPHNRSCRSDDIEDTIDYGEIVERMRQLLAENSFRLVEALAENVAQMIMGEFGAPWVKVRVAKPGILPGVRQLGVVIERGSRS